VNEGEAQGYLWEDELTMRGRDHYGSNIYGSHI
jgi:hypothetical protein